MDEMNFIPYWYYEKRKSRKMKMLNILSTVILVCDIVVFYNCLSNIKKYKNMSENIKAKVDTISAIKKDSNYKMNPEYKINKTIDIFKDSIQKKIEYSSAELSDRTIYLQIPVISHNMYVDVINILDGIQGVSIHGIDPINNAKSHGSTIKVQLVIR